MSRLIPSALRGLRFRAKYSDRAFVENFPALWLVFGTTHWCSKRFREDYNDPLQKKPAQKDKIYHS